MKLAIRFSIVLNFALAAVIVWLEMTGPSPRGRADFSRVMTNRVLRVKPRPAAPPPSTPVAAVVEVNEPFSWAQIESTDYRAYAANLRAIGCPEPTVRDLLGADVNDLYGARVKAVVDGVTGDFWRLLSHPPEMEEMVNAKYKELSALEEERDGLLAELFGGETPRELDRREETLAQQRAEADRIADFLSPDLRERYAAGREEFERAWAAFLQTPKLTGAQRAAKQQEFTAARWAALEGALTPAEIAELRLRESGGARLRGMVMGMDLSESEIRLAAQIQSARDEAKAEKRAPSIAMPEEEFRQVLGPERMAAYERGIDSRFQSFHRVAQRLELPEAVAVEAYDLRRTAEQAVERLRADKSISAEARAQALQTLNTEAAQALAARLGPAGFTACQKLDGDWLRRMNEPSR